MDEADLNAAIGSVAAFCESRNPEDLRDEMRLEMSRRGRSITLHERRPPWVPDSVGQEWTSMAVAQLRYDESAGTWSLYCRDSSDRWWLYDGIGPTSTVEPLLAEMDRDPSGIFWG